MSIKKRILILLSSLIVISLSFFISFASQIKVFANTITAKDIKLFTNSSNAVISASGFQIDTTAGKVGEINGIFSGDFEMDFSFTNSGFGSTEIAFYYRYASMGS